MLKALLIILGVLIAGSRLVCLISPALSRKMMKGMVDRQLFVIILGLFAALYGVAVFYFARLAIPADGTYFSAPWVWALLIGAVVCIAGLVVLIKPSIFAGRMAWLSSKPDNFLRMVMAVGILIGGAIIAYAVCLP